MEQTKPYLNSYQTAFVVYQEIDHYCKDIVHHRTSQYNQEPQTEFTLYERGGSAAAANLWRVNLDLFNTIFIVTSLGGGI